MKLYVFLGPSLSKEEARAALPAAYLPPVSEGDVYRLTRDARPWGIGIVDGYFEHTPAVWHKEILWALTRGVHVFGAASMGALRAAELAPFGMQGCGAIYEAFRSGRLEDDDEVAVVHEPADRGYRAVSEALVNMRFALARARRERVLDGALERQLLALAKQQFYAERSWPALLALAGECGLPARKLQRLGAWLKTARVDQKRQDALLLLHRMRAHQRAHPGPFEARFELQRTDAWEQVKRRIDQTSAQLDAAGEERELGLLEELRLDPALYARTHEHARLRALALAYAEDDATEGGERLRAALDGLRRERGLLAPEQLGCWLAQQALSAETFASLVEREARLQRVLELIEGEVARLMPDQLRLQGAYASLCERARAKQRVLRARGLEQPALSDVGLDEAVLWRWFFETRLGHAQPADLVAWARSVGYRSIAELRLCALREYCYCEHAQR